MKRKIAFLAALPLVAALLGSASPVAANPVEVQAQLAYPKIQASTGDSITRGFNVSRSCFLRDCPTYSWTTGTEATVNSHLLRIRTASSFSTSTLNYARTGAKVADLKAQLQSAAKAKANYVTVLIGANDACSSSASTMTSVASFTTSFESALSTYFSSRTAGSIFVASIPNVRGLYDVFKDNSTAKSAWSLYRICQSMLASGLTDAQRQSVVDRIVAFNSVLETTCAKYAKCKWDGGIVFDTAFTAFDVSTLDYFHPSVAGQQKLAAATWQASFWGTTP